LKNGIFDTSPGPLETPAPFRDFHRDPWHGIEAYQDQLWTFPRPSPAESCGAPFRGVRACPKTVTVCQEHCDRLECSHPYCERRNRDRRAGAIFDRLQLARRGREVIYQVYTVPPCRREAAAQEKTWKRWLRNLIAWLKKTFDLEYAAERSDPCGEDGERWHPHVNLAWVRKNGKGWLEPDELEAIKARWKKIIGLAPSDAISVYSSYTAQDQKIMHIARYLGRPWPRWAKTQKYLLRVKWFGKPPKVEKVKGPKLCKCCGCEEVYLTFGSREAAEAMAAQGYERCLEEAEDRRRHLLSMRPAKFAKYDVRISSGETLWSLQPKGG
jgi:hypothetical protein